MFRSRQRKTKILFGLSDAVLTFVAFEIAYWLRQLLPLARYQLFFLPPDTKTLLLGFSAITSVTIGYWLNVSGRLDSARIRTILRECFRQVAYSAMAFIVFLVFGHALEIPLARGFLFLFFTLSWFLLTSFRIAARNLVPLLDSGTKRTYPDRGPRQASGADGAQSGSVLRTGCARNRFSRAARRVRRTRRCGSGRAKLSCVSGGGFARDAFAARNRRNSLRGGFR